MARTTVVSVGAIIGPASPAGASKQSALWFQTECCKLRRGNTPPHHQLDTIRATCTDGCRAMWVRTYFLHVFRCNGPSTSIAMSHTKNSVTETARQEAVSSASLVSRPGTNISWSHLRSNCHLVPYQSSRHKSIYPSKKALCPARALGCFMTLAKHSCDSAQELGHGSRGMDTCSVIPNLPKNGPQKRATALHGPPAVPPAISLAYTSAQHATHATVGHLFCTTDVHACLQTLPERATPSANLARRHLSSPARAQDAQAPLKASWNRNPRTMKTPCAVPACPQARQRRYKQSTAAAGHAGRFVPLRAARHRLCHVAQLPAAPRSTPSVFVPLRHQHAISKSRRRIGSRPGSRAARCPGRCWAARCSAGRPGRPRSPLGTGGCTCVRAPGGPCWRRRSRGAQS